MKSKKLTLAIGLVSLLAVWFTLKVILESRQPWSGKLVQETLEQRFPEKVDTDDSIWKVLPFGYTLGPWPSHFRGEPIVTKLTYSKGPPKKFLNSITQLWQPVEAELTLMGPRTLIQGKSQEDWKKCFEARWGCTTDRQLLLDYVTRGKSTKAITQATWFDHPESEGPHGVHLRWEFEKYRVDDFVLLTQNGIAQAFEMKTAKTPLGQDALELFHQTLSSLKVNENLTSSREWIQSRIKTVNLSNTKKITDPKQRITRYIEIQNYLFSLLSVDPSKILPFFHLAGVTHLFTLDMIRLQTSYFENQESWILSSKPNLENLLRYSKDFDQADFSKQIEDLLQDVLLQQQKSLSILKK